MNFSFGFLAKGASWTVGAFLAAQAVRFGTNVALTRMLAPELFGLMIVVNGIRTGIELVLDVGIGQSVVRDPDGDDPTFYNSAWSLQILRGLLLTGTCVAAALPLAYLFELPILSVVLPVVAVQFLLSGCTSIGRFLLRRRLQFARSSLFDLAVQIVGSLTLLVAVYLSPSIWGLVWGGIATTAFTVLGSFLLVPNMVYRFELARAHVVRIFSFGKWIFLSSAVYFLSMNFDRLYLAKLIPLDQLGVYGLARGMADMINILFVRLGDMIIFPLVAKAGSDRQELRGNIRRNRYTFLALAATGIGIGAAWADIPFRFIFDNRYHAAGEMLSILVLGAWFSVLSLTGEASLLGLGKPAYSTAANVVKLIYLIIVLPVSVRFGMLGLTLAFALSDLVKYALVAVGSFRERFSFLMHDALLTVLLLGVFLASQYLRLALGLGTSVPLSPSAWN